MLQEKEALDTDILKPTGWKGTQHNYSMYTQYTGSQPTLQWALQSNLTSAIVSK